ncbi:MAG: LysR family transcriptional regulator [Alphaproteobacteria bacterium]|nr:LysR family transcriptional regulator [Alphaproteobacteria bacterium]
MDRIEAMTAFVAVCDASGFAPAARRLGRSPSAVTRLVASLENELGVRLLQRTTRAVRLTEAGARYVDRVRRLLADLRDAEEIARESAARPRGRLVVAAPQMFGRLHVAPVLSRYLQEFPEVTAELLLSDRYANLVEEGIDIAIRIGRLPDSGLIARRFGATRRIVVGSPAYLARQGGPPRHPEDLARYSFAASTGLSADPTWRFVGPDGRPMTIRVEPRLISNSNDVALGHALQGGGLARVLSYQAADALAVGTLVEVLREFAPPPQPIQAVYSSAHLLSPKVRGLLDLIEREAAWRFP